MQLSLPRPDDWHVHLRDGAMLEAVVPATAQHFGRALVMPNLVPPITTAQQAIAYRERIVAACPPGADFTPLVTCYLTDDADGEEIVKAWEDGAWHAAKLYPAHATTHSDHGVTDVVRIRDALAHLAEAGMPLCVHGEVVDPEVDVFDREARFLELVLDPLCDALPELRIVLEHVTTEAAVRFVQERSDRPLAATITPHHLWWNRNALFAGGLRPHAYCLPVLKRERDRRALVEAATSGSSRFFAGTDSAPHARGTKECDHGCAGIFNAPTALAAYATVFDGEGALEHLGGFLAAHGAAFYGVEPATAEITLERHDDTPPASVAVEGTDDVAVFLGGQTLPWRVLG